MSIPGTHAMLLYLTVRCILWVSVTSPSRPAPPPPPDLGIYMRTLFQYDVCPQAYHPRRPMYLNVVGSESVFCIPQVNIVHLPLESMYEGVSINNQPIPFPMDRDGHDFHALLQYMFYTLVQNCTHIESFFNKILNVKHG